MQIKQHSCSFQTNEIISSELCIRILIQIDDHIHIIFGKHGLIKCHIKASPYAKYGLVMGIQDEQVNLLLSKVAVTKEINDVQLQHRAAMGHYSDIQCLSIALQWHNSAIVEKFLGSKILTPSTSAAAIQHLLVILGKSPAN